MFFGTLAATRKASPLARAWFKIPLDEGTGLFARNEVSPSVTLSTLCSTPEQLLETTSNFGCTVEDYAGTAPDGTNNASRFTVTSGFGAAHLTIPTLPPGTYTISCWVKSLLSDSRTFAFWTDGIASTYTPTINIVDTDGWVRYSKTVTTTLDMSYIAVANHGGSATADLLIWGFQIEEGSTASDYPALNWQGFFNGDGLPTWNATGVDISSSWMRLISAAAPKTLDNGCAIYAAIKYEPNGQPISPIVTFGDEFPANFLMHTKSGTDKLGFTAGGVTAACTVDLNDGLWHLLCLVRDGAVIRLFLDKTQILRASGATGSDTLNTVNVGRVGNLVARFEGQMAYLAGLDYAPSAAQVRADMEWIKQQIALRGVTITDTPVYLQNEGDSISAFLTSSMSGDYLYRNVAISGSFLTQTPPFENYIDGDRKAAILESHRPGQRTIVHLLIGRNDIAVGGVSAAEFFPLLKAYCQDLMAVGIEVILGTLTPNSDDAYNVQRNLLNDMIRADTSFYTLICDHGADTEYGLDAQGDDTSIYSDGVHPTAATEAKMKAKIDAAFTAVLAL